MLVIRIIFISFFGYHFLCNIAYILLTLHEILFYALPLFRGVFNFLIFMIMAIYLCFMIWLYVQVSFYIR